MEHPKSLDLPVEACLRELGISSLAQCDVLVFLQRHQLSLVSAEQMARLLGYSYKIVGDALDALEALRLIRRSRASQGVRVYQIKYSESHPSVGFGQLIALTQNRAGRLLIANSLRHPPIRD